MSKQVDVAIGILVKRQQQRPVVLITRRFDGAVLGGYWEFPGGKIEASESARQCLGREFSEELGIQVHIDQELAVIEYAYDYALVRLHPFICRPVDVSGPIANLGVQEHRWVDADQIADYKFPPANEPLLRTVQHLLRQDLPLSSMTKSG